LISADGAPGEEESLTPSRLERIPSSQGNGGKAKKPYRPANEGIREWDPKPKATATPILLTERVSPSIRTAVGWLYPLEHYDNKLTLDPLSQYAELLLLMGSRGPVDQETLHGVLREARNHLDDPDYDRLLGYVDLLLLGRLGIPPEIE